MPASSDLSQTLEQQQRFIRGALRFCMIVQFLTSSVWQCVNLLFLLTLNKTWREWMVAHMKGITFNHANSFMAKYYSYKIQNQQT